MARFWFRKSFRQSWYALAWLAFPYAPDLYLIYREVMATDEAKSQTPEPAACRVSRSPLSAGEREIWAHLGYLP
jgi:hypothetical protein